MCTKKCLSYPSIRGNFLYIYFTQMKEMRPTKKFGSAAEIWSININLGLVFWPPTIDRKTAVIGVGTILLLLSIDFQLPKCISCSPCPFFSYIPCSVDPMRRAVAHLVHPLVILRRLQQFFFRKLFWIFIFEVKGCLAWIF